MTPGAGEDLSRSPDTGRFMDSSGRYFLALFLRPGGQPQHLKNETDSGGSVSVSEKGRPCAGKSPAFTPPMLPAPLPQ